MDSYNCVIFYRKLSASSEFIMTLDLVKWAWEAASGMEFLGSKKVYYAIIMIWNEWKSQIQQTYSF